MEDINFDPWDYANEFHSETLNYMSDDELEQINYYDNKDELNQYLNLFYERT